MWIIIFVNFWRTYYFNLFFNLCIPQNVKRSVPHNIGVFFVFWNANNIDFFIHFYLLNINLPFHCLCFGSFNVYMSNFGAFGLNLAGPIIFNCLLIYWFIFLSNTLNLIKTYSKQNNFSINFKRTLNLSYKPI